MRVGEEWFQLSAKEKQADLLWRIWRGHGADITTRSHLLFPARACERKGWVAIEGLGSEWLRLTLTADGERECRHRFGPQPKKRRTWKPRTAMR